MPELTEADIDRIIEMAWEDRTPFEAIFAQFGLSEQDVTDLLRRELKAGSWRRWRARINGRDTKHAALRTEEVTRFKSTRQKPISGNSIAKR